MLQFGAAAFDLVSPTPRNPIDTFTVNLELLHGASQDPDTMAWWASPWDAYQNTRTNLQAPESAMPRFLHWINTLPGKLQIPFREATKRRMPREWFEGAPKHTHDGLDDAISEPSCSST